MQRSEAMDSVSPAVRPAAGAAALASCGCARAVTPLHLGTVTLKACAGGLAGGGTSGSQTPVFCAPFPANVVRTVLQKPSWFVSMEPLHAEPTC